MNYGNSYNSNPNANPYLSNNIYQTPYSSASPYSNNNTLGTQFSPQNNAQTAAIEHAIDAKVASIVGFPARPPFWAYPFPYCPSTSGGTTGGGAA